MAAKTPKQSVLLSLPKYSFQVQKQTVDVLPLSKSFFQVKWEADLMYFQEVSGLDVETQPIEYRSGNSPAFSGIKMPSVKKSGNITLKKGVIKSDSKLWIWFNGKKMSTAKRVPVTISLLNEAGDPTMVWTLANAWPIKISSTDVKYEGNEVAVESIEIAHEGLSIANA